MSDRKNMVEISLHILVHTSCGFHMCLYVSRHSSLMGKSLHFQVG